SHLHKSRTDRARHISLTTEVMPPSWRRMADVRLGGSWWHAVNRPRTASIPIPLDGSSALIAHSARRDRCRVTKCPPDKEVGHTFVIAFDRRSEGTLWRKIVNNQ